MSDLVKQDRAIAFAVPESELAVYEDQLDLIRNTVAPRADNNNLKLYVYDCLRRNVHPLDKLIHYTQHFDKRANRDKYTPVISIDYVRIRAESSGVYAGQDDPVFTHEKGLDSKEDGVCKVTVYKIVAGVRCPFTGVARWKEFSVSGPQGMMWRNMPQHMLAKCAEAQALRKAFPGQLAGLYAESEMLQAGATAKEVEADTTRDEVLEALGVEPTPTEPEHSEADFNEAMNREQDLL